jgi:hypothetical protein
MIVEWVKAGLKRAKAEGKVFVEASSWKRGCIGEGTRATA